MNKLFSLKEKINLAQCETLGIEVTEVYTLKEYFNVSRLKHTYSMHIFESIVTWGFTTRLICTTPSE